MTYFKGLLLISIYRTNLFSIFLLILLSCSINSAQETEPSVSASYGTGSKGMLSVYQKYVSPVKGGNTCPMHPSCSQYSRLVFSEESVPLALMSTASRLARCGHEVASYDKVPVDGLPRLFDHPFQLFPYNNTLEKLVIHDSFQELYWYQTPSHVLSFDGFLIKNREYQNARYYYYHQLYHGGVTLESKERLYLQIIYSYLLEKKYNEVISFYHSHMHLIKNSTNLYELDLLLARAYILQEEFEKALVVLKLSSQVGTPLLNEENRWLQAVCNGYLFNWEKTEVLLSSLESESYSPYARNGDTLDLYVQELKEKSPFLGGLFSTIIPGSGYLYASKKETALASFIINGLLLWGTYEAFDNKQYALGGCFSLVTTTWYFGNIRGSANEVKKHNYKQKKKIFSKIFDNP